MDPTNQKLGNLKYNICGPYISKLSLPYTFNNSDNYHYEIYISLIITDLV